MGEQSAIEWTDATWNPITGCTKISPGCKFCYAERVATRLHAMGNPRYRSGFRLTLHPDQLTLPLRWREPRRIFVNSMSDLFHEQVPFEYVDQVFHVMARAERHIYQVLTKRADRLLAWHRWHGAKPVRSHIWLGVSVESEAYCWRIDRLREVDVPIRFVSAEPLLGPLTSINLSGIAWLITGGESAGSPDRALVTRTMKGWQPKPEAVRWVRELRDICQERHVAFFHKQWGGPLPSSGGRRLDRQTWDEMPPLLREPAQMLF